MPEEQVDDAGRVEPVSRDEAFPVVCLSIRGDENFNAFDVTTALRERGVTVPPSHVAPEDRDIAALDVVVRKGFGRDVAGELASDIERAPEALRGAGHGCSLRDPVLSGAARSFVKEAAPRGRRRQPRPSLRQNHEGSGVPSKTRGVW